MIKREQIAHKITTLQHTRSFALAHHGAEGCYLAFSAFADQGPIVVALVALLAIALIELAAVLLGDLS